MKFITAFLIAMSSFSAFGANLSIANRNPAPILKVRVEMRPNAAGDYQVVIESDNGKTILTEGGMSLFTALSLRREILGAGTVRITNENPATIESIE